VRPPALLDLVQLELHSSVRVCACVLAVYPNACLLICVYVCAPACVYSSTARPSARFFASADVSAILCWSEGEFTEKKPNGFGRVLYHSGVQYHGEVCILFILFLSPLHFISLLSPPFLSRSLARTIVSLSFSVVCALSQSTSISRSPASSTISPGLFVYLVPQPLFSYRICSPTYTPLSLSLSLSLSTYTYIYIYIYMYIYIYVYIYFPLPLSASRIIWCF
jgi:hypothetical protein